ncbi:hypothetical protein [Chitiniphilus shinanonensis]|uniref:hypothetical protein n=1 Tax=Chitiniphilus shinanonensis TaxID=553088 RepID=UPI003340B8F1
MRPLLARPARPLDLPLPLARGTGHAGPAMVFALLALLATWQSPPAPAPAAHANLQSAAIPTWMAH